MRFAAQALAPAAQKPTAPSQSTPAKAAAAPAKPAAAQPKTQIARAGVGAVPSGPNKVRVWLFSAQSEGEAIAYLRKVEERHTRLLTGIDGAVAPVRFDDRKVFYRVVAGGFPDWSAGRDWCKALKTDAPGTFCKVLPARGAGN